MEDVEGEEDRETDREEETEELTWERPISSQDVERRILRLELRRFFFLSSAVASPPTKV